MKKEFEDPKVEITQFGIMDVITSAILLLVSH